MWRAYICDIYSQCEMHYRESIKRVRYSGFKMHDIGYQIINESMKLDISYEYHFSDHLRARDFIIQRSLSEKLPLISTSFIRIRARDRSRERAMN